MGTRIAAIRNDPRVGKGSCSSLDERWTDAELIEALCEDVGPNPSPEEALRWAYDIEGLWLEQGANASSGEPNCPLVQAHKDWTSQS